MMTATLLAGERMHWRSLPDLPQALGGQFVGSIGETLVVAGGSYWDKPPWDKGTKTWSDKIYVLEKNAQRWRLAGTLPQPLAYGASVDTAEAMVLIGGQTPVGLSTAVLRLRLKNGVAAIDRLGDLPNPQAMMGAVSTRTTVYLAGGQPASTPAKALKAFLAIPLADLLAGRGSWRELPSWEGPPRFFSQFAACGESLYLAGGTDLVAAAGKDTVRNFLRDAHRYTPEGGWQKLPEMPRTAQAGLAACHEGQFYVFGGSDGTLSEELREKHPGFRRDLLAFDPATNVWREAGVIPASLVTTGIAKWNGEYVIAGGEDRPGHRSAKVVAVRIENGGGQ